jgi:APA family basic amino acid/polyamine antiporter
VTLFRTNPIERLLGETVESGHRLRKDLGPLDLTVFGIGVVIGTGIFVLTGRVARENAGPAVALSFVVAGIACALAALCYAEFASTVPVAGSAYTFSYVTLGEFPAWIIGWNLVLEMALAAAVVAVGWSGYATSLLSNLGVHLPPTLAGDGATFNLPAVFVVLAVTAVLTFGVKLSSRFNAVIVAVKLAVVLVVIVAGLFFVKGANYRPFIPPAKQTPEVGGVKAPLIQVLFDINPVAFGVLGVFTAAAVVFFAYIGFDIVATAAEETRNPRRDLPIGIIGSLAICTALYVAVSLVVVGMQPYSRLDVDAPLAEAFTAVGQPVFALIIALGVVTGLTTVVLILLLGQTRVLFAMSRDGLLPRGLAAVHPRFGTPYRATLIIGAVVALVAGLTPLSALAELVNIGTLFAFVVVAVAVLVLRRTRPDLPRAFRVPAVPLIPILAVVSGFYLMLNLPVETWLRFAGWTVLGVVGYFAYGFRKSRLATEPVAAGATPGSSAPPPADRPVPPADRPAPG